MKYFDKNFLSFLRELSLHNDTTWFNENKERYVWDIKIPFENFVSDMIKELQPSINNLHVTSQECIFRINRDVRFGKNKTPYKTHVSALISRNGKKDKTTPGLYIEFSTAKVMLYSGCHEMDNKQLEKVRRKIFNETDRFNELITSPPFIKTFLKIHGEQSKRVPKPYDEIANEQPLILNKSFYYYTVFPKYVVLKENLIDLLLDKYNDCKDLNTFFEEALGK